MNRNTKYLNGAQTIKLRKAIMNNEQRILNIEVLNRAKDITLRKINNE